MPDPVSVRRTPEQTLAFELARSRALREGSHTTADDSATQSAASKPKEAAPMMPNPAYQGVSGIFTMLTDALSGKYQQNVPKQ